MMVAKGFAEAFLLTHQSVGERLVGLRREAMESAGQKPIKWVAVDQKAMLQPKTVSFKSYSGEKSF
jgi:hypothetical protein